MSGNAWKENDDRKRNSSSFTLDFSPPRSARRWNFTNIFQCTSKFSKSKQAKQKVEDFAILPSVGLIMDEAKQGDNALGSIQLSVCLSICHSVCTLLSNVFVMGPF